MSDIMEVLRTIDSQKDTLDRLRPFDSPSVLHALDVEYTYESNRIEGNTLTLNETALIIDKGLTVSGKPISDSKHVKYGMVIDFTDLKKIVNEEIVDIFDHATVFNKNTPHVELAKELIERGHHVLLVDYQPTSEMMVIDFAEKIKKRLPENIKLYAIKLQETDTSFAEWFASDN